MNSHVDKLINLILKNKIDFVQYYIVNFFDKF